MSSKIPDTTSIADAVMVVAIIVQLVGVQVDRCQLFIRARVFLHTERSVSAVPWMNLVEREGNWVGSYTRGVQGRYVAVVEALVGHMAWVTIEEDCVHCSEHLVIALWRLDITLFTTLPVGGKVDIGRRRHVAKLRVVASTSKEVSNNQRPLRVPHEDDF